MGWLPDNDFKMLCNATKSQMQEAIDDFTRNMLEAEEPLGLFYYADMACSWMSGSFCLVLIQGLM